MAGSIGMNKFEQFRSFFLYIFSLIIDFFVLLFSYGRFSSKAMSEQNELKILQILKSFSLSLVLSIAKTKTS